MANCRACGKEIYFLRTKAGKNIPVNAESLEDAEIEAYKKGKVISYNHQRHVSHYSDCPKAAEFRKK